MIAHREGASSQKGKIISERPKGIGEF